MNINSITSNFPFPVEVLQIKLLLLCQLLEFFGGELHFVPSKKYITFELRSNYC